MINIDKMYSDLAAIRSGVPLFEDAMVPGTPRRWVERDLSPAELARQAAEVREDRINRIENSAKGLKPTGNSKAPLNVGVLDAKVDVFDSVKELEEAVCDRLGLTPLVGHNDGVYAIRSAEDRISRIIGLLDRIVADEDLAEHVRAESARLSRRTRQALGEDEPVYKIKARCPVCDSLSLRAFPDREIVVCVNSRCACDDDTCPCHAARPVRHRWLYDQWPDLNDVISAETRRAA
ncbi:hypothetical protein [Microbispora bryophytorum]|uniref:hypothetical protein n=1 Tax=Microbispora bryophytorum TaxID=1460882 RepID=UPI0033C40A56